MMIKYGVSGTRAAAHSFVRWIPLVLWMLVIFCFSAQPASESAKLSAGATKEILALINHIHLFQIDSGAVVQSIAQLEHFVRKSAHFLVYFVLGILSFFAFNKNRQNMIRSAFVFCILYAISDELHQLFVPGRSGQIQDVILDSIGALLGILLLKFQRRILNRHERDSLKENGGTSK